MKKLFVVGAFTLSAMAWAGAQQAGSVPETSRSSQVPGATQPQTATPGADQNGAAGATGAGATGATGAGATGAPSASATQAGNAPVTQGCLGGTNPNFTLTSDTGKSYKLVLPPNADGSRLTPHVGESVMVMGDTSADSINVTKIGKGNGTCGTK